MTKSVFKRFTATVALALSCVIALALPGLASAQQLSYGSLTLSVPDEATITEVDTSEIDEASIQEAMSMLQMLDLDVDEATMAVVCDIVANSTITVADAPSEKDIIVYVPASVLATQAGLDLSELAGIDEATWGAVAEEASDDLAELYSMLPGAGLEVESAVVEGNPVLAITVSNIAINEVEFVCNIAVAFIPEGTEAGMVGAIGVMTADGSSMDDLEAMVVHLADDAVNFGGGTLTAPAGSMTIHVEIWGMEFMAIIGEDGVALAADINSPFIASELGLTGADVIALLDEVFADAPEGITYQGVLQGDIAAAQIDVTGALVQMLIAQIANEFATGSMDIEIPGIEAADIQQLLAELSTTTIPDLTIQAMLGIDAEQIQVFFGAGIAGGQTLPAIMG